ncbi:MAG: response regulator, partial [Betaproteobacteria bacterium]|nr:response regulator [Betaproteobacteria bacterium]
AGEEAKQHVAALLWHLADLRESRHPAVSDGFLQEAHTLAVVNRTMGFNQIAELAHALEQWLEAHMGHPIALSSAQLSLLERTVAMLDDMNLAVRNRQEPQAQPELINRLQTDREVAAEQAKAAQPVAEAHLPESRISVALAPPQPAKAVQRAQLAMEQGVTQEGGEHLLPIFLEDANDIFPQVGSDMRAWCGRPEEVALGRSLQRSLHTLKGSARMAGAMHVGDLTHHMEERVVQALSQAQHDATFWDELENCYDGIADALEQLRSAKPMADQAIVGAGLLRDTAQRAMPAAMLRVRSGTVDRLVNQAGEISVTRARAEAELHGFKDGLLELVDSVNRLRGQLREIEIQAESQMQARVSLFESTAEKFDPLEFDRFTRLQELTRFMNESVHDVLTVQQTLLKNLDKASAALAAQTYLNRELQQNLMAIRMVPFASISERLYRIVRQTCKEMGKQASLELHGAEVELDHNVLDRMTAPLEHMLRNAIDHGLESPQQRERAGKPPIGVIRLSLHQENNEVIFEFSDDGAGINLARLRQKAVELGLPQLDENASDEQVMQLISTPGLTTATEVSEVSGRGVGMDVVRSEITALGGRIEVSSKRGKGTRFISHLPRTLMAIQALLVRAGQAVYAIPSGTVEQVQQVKPAALKGIYRQGRVEWKGKPYPLHYLPRLLGNEECAPESHPYNRVLLLHSGEQRLAVHVDELIGNQEVVVKNMGPQLAHLPGIAGATVLGNGSVVLVLNPWQLAQHIPGVRKTAKTAAVEPTPAPPLVMVVDDSLTVRKITGRLLARAGYQVVTAKDGVDALERLGEINPAVMLLDIEMPRMDGFELTRRLRRDPGTRRLPIIMITSRIAEKHREHAYELGVNAYLGKPYQEEDLLRHIAAMVAVPLETID